MGSIVRTVGKLFGGDGGATAAATQQAAAQADATAREIERQRQAQIQAQNDMQANFSANLQGENKATVVAGGTADALGVGDDATRRRRQASGLASTLGLNL